MVVSAMRMTLDPFRLLLISLAGWINQQQQDVIEYLREENRVLSRINAGLQPVRRKDFCFLLRPFRFNRW